VPLRRGGRRVFMYKQTMDGLAVVGSSLRLMADEARGQSRVLYAAGRIAIRPQGGLPAPTVTPREALAAAQAHPTGRALTAWSEPELVAIYDDPPRGSAEAYPAWKCAGSGGAAGPGGMTIESYTFYVDAITGIVARVHSNVMRFADITGRVKANATPTDTNAPEQLGPDTALFPPVSLWSECPNVSVEMDLSDVVILAYDSQPPHALVASAYTDSNGNYTLDVPNGMVVNLEAHLVGPGAAVYYEDDLIASWPDIWGEPLEPMVKENIMAPTSSPEETHFYFNETPIEGDTANVNVHLQMTKTWYYLGPLATDNVPVIPVVLNSTLFRAAYLLPGGIIPGKWLQLPGESLPVPWPGRIFLGPSSGSASLNMAYSTIISHEYGHFVLDHGFGIGINFPGFHEGFADVVSHLTHDTEVMGQDFTGCDTYARKPLVSNRQYPECSEIGHDRGEVLSAVWLRILIGMRVVYGQSAGWDPTRDLHLDWLPLAQPPGGDPSDCPTRDQSASADTLIEVLIADDDDDTITNGTPHCQIILDAFAAQNIFPPFEIDCGGDGLNGSGRMCYADFDGSTGVGVLDIFDFLAFQASFVEGEPSACDCDTSTGSGECDIFDFICFQAAFAAGCEKE
ncbi:MAG: hypothetical protein IID31_11070, partial [Planctomycetes bacterium]|nr:hypothetical protein [Planctomycetota bacterium]